MVLKYNKYILRLRMVLCFLLCDNDIDDNNIKINGYFMLYDSFFAKNFVKYTQQNPIY